ncbi:MAG: amidohydrolase, partial [Clostridiales bacterium]|nr:amidohydrolase [Clostridiales bacterium]
MEQDFQNILERLKERAESCQPEMIQWRRDFHVHPELGWCEFRTASIVADHLRKTGWQVWTGPMVTPKTIRMGVPSEMELEEAWKKALDSGGIEEEMEPMKGGYTGVVGVLENGKGPVAA